MNDQLIKFIELCLLDGNLTDSERKVIYRKAEELKVPKDECEIIINGLEWKYRNNIASDGKHESLSPKNEVFRPINIDFSVQNRKLIKILKEFDKSRQFQEILRNIWHQKSSTKFLTIVKKEFKGKYVDSTVVTNRLNRYDGKGFFFKNPECMEYAQKDNLLDFISKNEKCIALYLLKTESRYGGYMVGSGDIMGNHPTMDYINFQGCLVLVGHDKVLIYHNAWSSNFLKVINISDLLNPEGKDPDQFGTTTMLYNLKDTMVDDELQLLKKIFFSPVVYKFFEKEKGVLNISNLVDFHLKDTIITELKKSKNEIDNRIWNILNRLDDVEEEIKSRISETENFVGQWNLMDSIEAKNALIIIYDDGALYRGDIPKSYVNIFELIEYVMNVAAVVVKLINSDDRKEFDELFYSLEKVGLTDSTFQKKVIEKLDEISKGINSLQVVMQSEIRSMKSEIISELVQLTDKVNWSTNKVVSQLDSLNKSQGINNVLLGVQIYQIYKANQKLNLGKML